jgi:glyoxylase-like metal-dependent hydrolase (beta-lactamase superfamily II)
MNAVPIHAHNPGPITGDGNWTWLLPGRVPTLIDAGTGDPRHLQALHEALGLTTLAQVLVTHGHGDHASGTTAIAEHFPHPRFLKMPWPDRDRKWSVAWEPVADGDTIAAGDTTLTVIHTPGHSPDHICLWHAETRSLFCGDLAIRGTTVWIPTQLQGDLAAYLASLERVIAINPARMMPAHGPVIDQPVALLRSYLQHRHEREDQILAALRQGDATAEAIVARVYHGLKEALVPLAAESVNAHLLKLEREGRTRRDGDAWRMTSLSD